MEADDRFVIYLRLDPAHAANPEAAEEPLADFPTYAEARERLRQLHVPDGQGVIRFVGSTGGGD